MKDEIWIVGMEDIEDRGALKRIAEMRFGRKKVPVDTIVENLRNLLASFSAIFDATTATDALKEFSLEEVSLKLEISAKGKVSLLGSGGEAGGLGGIGLTFKRSKGVAPTT